jgi:release factor glutamine methyltransferase
LSESNWLEGVGGVFDIIISNPPYIDPAEALENSVKNYDPHLALYAGEGGLDAYKAILPSLKAHMHNQTQCFFEIGYQQKQSVCALIENAGYTVSKVYQDLSGHHRVIQFHLG